MTSFLAIMTPEAMDRAVILVDLPSVDIELTGVVERRVEVIAVSGAPARKFLGARQMQNNLFQHGSSS
jgi:hypothetical protein